MNHAYIIYEINLGVVNTVNELVQIILL